MPNPMFWLVTYVVLPTVVCLNLKRTVLRLALWQLANNGDPVGIPS